MEQYNFLCGVLSTQSLSMSGIGQLVANSTEQPDVSYTVVCQANVKSWSAFLFETNKQTKKSTINGSYCNAKNDTKQERKSAQVSLETVLTRNQIQLGVFLNGVLSYISKTDVTLPMCNRI